MTLEKVFRQHENEPHSPISKFVKQNNPYKTLTELYAKAGLSEDEIKAFQKCPDNITVKNLNKILSLCEFDLRMVALFGEELAEENVYGNLTQIFTAEVNDWEEDDWEEEMEEDEAYF